jgi:hypothetical protein
MTRRTHSTIDSLPADIRQTITAMVVDGDWPDDFDSSELKTRKPEGKPVYEDVVSYCSLKGHSVSRSAVGRWAKGMLVFELMRKKADIVKGIMSDITAENASASQKAAAEIITAQAIDMAVEKNLKPKDVMMIASAIRNCAETSMKADKYIREQLSAKVKSTAGAVKDKLSAAGVTKIVQKQIDAILMGITKS